MGRFWIGILLLVIFLVLGIWISCFMDATHQTISDTLLQASAQALQGNEADAAALAAQAKATWDANWHTIAAAADHAPMDEIDGLFSQLSVFSNAGRIGDFAACCARLSKLVAAMGEAHKLTWWNFL